MNTHLVATAEAIERNRSPEPATPAGNSSERRAGPKRVPVWALWLLPAISDVIFLKLLYALALRPAGATLLLFDADTGWHIRNGEHILQTLSIPRTDYFSYTMAGRPWFAWEWLYDVIVGAIHSVAGLNGVVLFSAALIAFTFGLLFTFTLRRSGNLVTAALMAVLAGAAAGIHMLARPHVVTWLFTVLWVELLFRHRAGKRAALLWMLPIMLVWVNVHGGFVFGFMLLGVFVVGAAIHCFSSPHEVRRAARRYLTDLLAISAACFLASFATPYGYKLHIHVISYLSNSWLMDHIGEFMAPNFHEPAALWFEIMVLVTLVAALLPGKKIQVTDVLLCLFCIHAGLYAARNIPLAAIVLAMVVSTWLAESVRSASAACDASWVHRMAAEIEDFSAPFARLQTELRGHLLPVAATVAFVLIALHGGKLGSWRVLNAHFDPERLPVQAAEFIAAQGIHDSMFNTDDFSGYLIYRLHPGFRVFFDDRHDFYGPDFIRSFRMDANWRAVIDRYRIRYVLVRKDSEVATLLRESKAWKPIYQDNLAVILACEVAGK